MQEPLPANQMPEVPTSSVTSASSKPNTLLIVAGVVLVIILFVLLFFIFTLNNSSNTAQDQNATPTPTIKVIEGSNTGELITNPERLKTETSETKLAATFPGTIVLKGQAQGFFEGTVNFRIINANRQELFTGSFTVSDNYENFVNFEETVTLPTISAALKTPTGTVQYYDVSMKDGSETIMQEVEVVIN